MQKSLQELHEEMQHNLRSFAIGVRQYQVPETFDKNRERNAQYVPALWLNRYIESWDELERCGIKMQICIPSTPHFPDLQSLRWSEHAGYEEPKRGQTSLPPYRHGSGLGDDFDNII